MYKNVKEKSNEILRLYKEGVMLTEICSITSSSQPTVKKILAFFEIDYDSDKKRIYQDKLDKVIELYNEGKSQIFIEQNLGLTRKTIRELLKRHNLKYRTKSEQSFIRYETEIDETVFDILTPDALYWIGMLYSDGHIEQKKEASIELILHNNDVNHLEKFKVFLKSNRPITPDHGDCSRMRFNSMKIRDRLVDLGFTHNKSNSIIPHIDLKHSRDFWRGCVDGDGGVYLKSNSYPCDTMTLCGTLETIFDFIIFCSKECNIKDKYPSPSNKDGYVKNRLYQVHYYSQDAIKVLNLLYKDSTTYLERKYQIYKEILKTN